MNRLLAFLALALAVSLQLTARDSDLITREHLVSPHVTQQKVVDGGGTGPYSSIVVTDESMPDYVIYRPVSLANAVQQERGPLPVLFWGNGACANTSAGYERMLAELASRGYVVVAIGEMQQVYGDREDRQTSSSMMHRAIDWLCRASEDRQSDYYHMVDTLRMAAAGHSCGGAQTLANAGDPRLKTYMICNAGMGDIEMADASSRSLPTLHGPVLYLTGGPDDVAYRNAQLDYERIQHVPVFLGDLPTAGHGGTYREPQGGDFGRMVIAWMDWQLKGRGPGEAIFVRHDLSAFPGWSMKHKNYGDLCISNGPDRTIYGIVSEPTRTLNGLKGVAIISHGFNGTHHFGRDYFQTLNQLGYLVYTFDYPHGSVHSLSDPNTMGMSVFDQRRDLEAVVRYFRQQPDVDTTRIVLVGESQGGFISAITAAELREQVQALVLIYPALCIPDNWNERYPDISQIPDTTWLWNVPLSRRFFEELHGMNAYDIIPAYQGPVLIVQGDKDAVVAVDYARRAAEVYHDATLRIIEGAGHGFRPEERVISNRYVHDFLQALPTGDRQFVKGADIGMLPMQERRGQVFRDRMGQERECIDLLRDYGINAVRLRVWVDPEHGMCDSTYVLQLAQRAQAQGMDIMLSFHLSNAWADPGSQPIPKGWMGHSYREMKRDVTRHITETFQCLLSHGIRPRWAQVGNETSNGLLWNVETDEHGHPVKDAQGNTTVTYSMGHIDRQPRHYAGFIRAGYDAIKAVCPDCIVLVHLDNGFDQALYDRNLGTLLRYGGKFDMIGMSLYPYWALQSGKETSADQTITDGIRNIRHLWEKFGRDVMIVETGFEVDESRPELMQQGGEQLQRIVHEAMTETEGHCRGVFYWEPQCTPGGYKLGAFGSDGAPTAIMDGFLTK